MAEVYIAENNVITKSILLKDFDKFQESNPNGDFDLRHKIYSLNTKHDISMYLNYMSSVLHLAQTVGAGTYPHLLELGFFPAVMLPSYLPEDFYDTLEKLLNIRGIPFTKIKASSFVNAGYMSKLPDIWVNKLDVAEALGCKPEEVTLKKILQKEG